MARKRPSRIISSNPQGEAVLVEKNTLFYQRNHKHQCLELEYVTRGTGTMTYRNKIFPLQRGCIYIVRPSDSHSYYFPEAEGTLYRIVLPDGCLPQSIRQTFSKNKHRGVTYLDETLCLYLDSLFAILTACSSREESADTLYTRESLLNIIMLIYLDRFRDGLLRSGEEEEESEAVSNAKCFIWEHYNEKITADDIAAYAGYNTRYLCRVFKKQTGFTFFGYMKDFRLEQAALMLRGTDEGVENLCKTCGYTDYPNFTRDFRAKFELTPTEYREKNKGKNLPEDFVEDRDLSLYVIPREENNK